MPSPPVPCHSDVRRLDSKCCFSFVGAPASRCRWIELGSCGLCIVCLALHFIRGRLPTWALHWRMREHNAPRASCLASVVFAALPHRAQRVSVSHGDWRRDTGLSVDALCALVAGRTGSESSAASDGEDRAWVSFARTLLSFPQLGMDIGRCRSSCGFGVVVLVSSRVARLVGRAVGHVCSVGYRRVGGLAIFSASARFWSASA